MIHGRIALIYFAEKLVKNLRKFVANEANEDANLQRKSSLRIVK